MNYCTKHKQYYNDYCAYCGNPIKYSSASTIELPREAIDEPEEQPKEFYGKSVAQAVLEDAEQPEEPTALEVSIKNKAARKRAAKLKKEEDERLAKSIEEPTLWGRFLGSLGYLTEKQRNQIESSLKSKLLELAEDLRMEKEDERPEITEWLVSEDYTKGYNKAVEEHNKRLDTFISKLNG